MSDIINKKKDKNRADDILIRILQIVMVSGLFLILLGIYFHMYSDTIKTMGVTGMVISSCCVAIGMIMSLPTKMYITFVLVNREQQLTQAKRLKEASINKITT
ncbi:MAG: putative membrane protein [Alphaproteobacteria bacterium]|jgi:uncharacterized membrane protein